MGKLMSSLLTADSGENLVCKVSYKLAQSSSAKAASHIQVCEHQEAFGKRKVAHASYTVLSLKIFFDGCLAVLSIPRITL